MWFSGVFFLTLLIALLVHNEFVAALVEVAVMHQVQTTECSHSISGKLWVAKGIWAYPLLRIKSGAESTRILDFWVILEDLTQIVTDHPIFWSTLKMVFEENGFENS